ncbi:Nidogen-1 [Armadillidium vulgare]|nr:Nidogen-1 [Armadillidium vulgare]
MHCYSSQKRMILFSLTRYKIAAGSVSILFLKKGEFSPGLERSNISVIKSWVPHCYIHLFFKIYLFSSIRETSDVTTVERFIEAVKENFENDEEFVPESVFIVTWDGVASFQARRDKLNTFQVVMGSNRRDSYVILNYADGGLQWLQGDGKTSGLPDALGQAGFIAEDGRLFTIRGSGTDQVRNLDKWSNIDKPGAWIYKVGRIHPGKNIQPPNKDLGDEEDSEDYEQYSEEGASCAAGGSVCHSSAICNDYESGFCCACKEGFYGNGINYTPIRVTGKLTGAINGIEIEEADLHSYVLSSEGRTYTAVSRIPKDVGYDLQSLTGIGEGIAWLFAIPKEGVSNGFIITGGEFNRTVEMKFPQTGHKAIVEQTFTGLDVFSNVAVKTKISGSLPTIPIGSELEIEAFNEEFTRVKAGRDEVFAFCL